jgi:hypothetical protein
MSKLHKATATVGAVALLAAPIGLAAGPAYADGPQKERHFRVAGAKVDFTVEKDDGKFEVDVDIDNAKPGSRWRVILKHDGKRYLKQVYRADREGDVDIDKNRPNTKGKDVFRVKVKKIGGGSKARVIRMR